MELEDYCPDAECAERWKRILIEWDTVRSKYPFISADDFHREMEQRLSPEDMLMLCTILTGPLEGINDDTRRAFGVEPIV